MKRERDGWDQAGVALIASRWLVARLLGWHFAWMCACSPPASFDAGMLVCSSALLCLQRPGDCGNRTREREMHSSRIWPLGLGACLCVRQVSWRGGRAPGWRAGRSDGSCLLGCLGCIDVGMHVCLSALSGLKHGWLPPPSRTPCPCCVGFATSPNTPDKLRQREESTR